MGGNITTSISDHFTQFCTLDIFNKGTFSSFPQKYRNFKNFSHAEFEEEFKAIDWITLLSNKNSDNSLNLFYETIEKLLDEMAPVKSLNLKEKNFFKDLG